MASLPPGTISVWSDPGCPWSHLALWRLWEARARLGLEDRVRLDHHAFPLELFNSEPTPRSLVEAEMGACREVEPRAGWQAWQAPEATWPVTMLPPMEAVQATKEQGLAASERLDRGLRRAFFGESRCISLRHVILEVAQEEELDVAALAEALDSGRARRSVMEDWRAAGRGAARGSPHLFTADGGEWQNPGIELHWEQRDGVEVPVMDADRVELYAEMLHRATGSA